MFLAGAALAYSFLPRGLQILLGFTPENIENIISVDRYLSFFLRMMLVFGLGFLLPLLVVALNFAGVLPADRLRSWWRWIVLGVVIFAALATPTGDPFNLSLLAGPMLAAHGPGVAGVLGQRPAPGPPRTGRSRMGRRRDLATGSEPLTPPVGFTPVERRRIGVLVNPTSGRGRAARHSGDILRGLASRGDHVLALEGDSPEHAHELIEAAMAEGLDALVAVGGDGTVHMALQSVVGTPTALGVVPLGTGNDAATSLGIPTGSAADAVRVVLAGATRAFDVGHVTHRRRPEPVLPVRAVHRLRLHGQRAGQPDDPAERRRPVRGGDARRAAQVLPDPVPGARRR